MKITEINASPQLNDGNNRIKILSTGVSGSIKTFGFSLMKLYFPNNWTTCDIAFQESIDGVNWKNVKIETISGDVLDYILTDCTADTSRAVGTIFIGTPYTKIVCSVPQSEDVEIVTICLPLLGRL